MKLIVPNRIEAQWKQALGAAGRREIGGVLLGAFVDPGRFKLLEITIQRNGGTISHFVRVPKLHEDAIQRFFERTGHDYERFNYLGEWHSHPLFPTKPSWADVRSMYRIVADPDVGANFAALLIVRLTSPSDLEMSACVFRSGVSVQEIRVFRERVGTRIPDWRRMARTARRIPMLSRGADKREMITRKSSAGSYGDLRWPIRSGRCPT
jgi:[CysO sulfur-carrier protein]-S-L-cysteine hydrolase